ncbi:hypothetical protein DFJ74DRAFT_674179 [Hyaloraphidium curvatum]|nr:hypothetical protein DFJ74DRAFT_674179 [Hyaloraphidium curvatum]
MPGVILSVRFTSGLSDDEVRKTMAARAPEFRRVPGLLQKFYGKDASDANSYTGIYIFASEADCDAYRQSDLAKSIPTAYKAVVTSMRREVYEVIAPLFPMEGL